LAKPRGTDKSSKKEVEWKGSLRGFEKDEKSPKRVHVNWVGKGNRKRILGIASKILANKRKGAKGGKSPPFRS